MTLGKQKTCVTHLPLSVMCRYSIFKVFLLTGGGDNLKSLYPPPRSGHGGYSDQLRASPLPQKYLAQMEGRTLFCSQTLWHIQAWSHGVNVHVTDHWRHRKHPYHAIVHHVFNHRFSHFRAIVSIFISHLPHMPNEYLPWQNKLFQTGNPCLWLLHVFCLLDS